MNFQLLETSEQEHRRSVIGQIGEDLLADSHFMIEKIRRSVTQFHKRPQSRQKIDEQNFSPYQLKRIKVLNRQNSSKLVQKEQREELTEAEKSKRLRKELEDHYNIQISKLYSQRVPNYLLDDQPKKEGYGTCAHLLQKVGDTSNQSGIPSIVLDQEIRRVFNNKKTFKTKPKDTTLDRANNTIQVFKQEGRINQKFATLIEEQFACSEIAYQDLFIQLAKKEEDGPPLKKSFWSDKQNAIAVYESLKSWKSRKAKALEEVNKQINKSILISETELPVTPRIEKPAVKSQLSRKTVSRFQVKNLDKIFEPIVFREDQQSFSKPQEQQNVKQSQEVPQLFILNKKTAPNEFHKRNCKLNCSIYKNRTTRNDLVYIYAENGYLPKRYQSKDVNAPKFSVFDSQDYHKQALRVKLESRGCTPNYSQMRKKKNAHNEEEFFKIINK